MFVRALIVGGVAAAAASSALGQASFGVSGYSENFDGMGSAGTAAPAGWRHFPTAFGSNTTWASSISANGANSVATTPVTAAATTLVAITSPTANQNNGYNAANRSPAPASDRVLATAPTTVAGSIIQLALSNGTGSDLPAGFGLTIGFDTVRYTAPTTANELPGYWLFASVDGTTWSNVGPNPTISTVPNTAGTTTSSLSFSLPGAWVAGQPLYFRWVDDNALQTSPDQIIGLNNVSIIPTPGTLAIVGAGVLMGLRRRRS
jgi:hypothetical protein